MREIKFRLWNKKESSWNDDFLLLDRKKKNK